MSYWKLPEQIGLDEKQINVINEKLWKEAQQTASRSCPDCGVFPGEYHQEYCDIARCQKCGCQALSCDCEDKGKDIWDGLWPGTKKCYENKFIIFCDEFGWSFNFNRLATSLIK
jgi:hypothetical protein